jgi:hypothetical protein
MGGVFVFAFTGALNPTLLVAERRRWRSGSRHGKQLEYTLVHRAEPFHGARRSSI